MLALGKAGWGGGGNGGESSLRSAIATLQIKNGNSVKAHHIERPFFFSSLKSCLSSRGDCLGTACRGEGLFAFLDSVGPYCPVVKPGAFRLRAAYVPKAMFPKLQRT